MMTALVSPVEDGYVSSVVCDTAGFGLAKGTLFWTIDKQHPTGGLYQDGIYSSTNGTTWVDRTSEVVTAFDWGGVMIYFASPAAIGDVFICYAQLSGTGVSPTENLWVVGYTGSAWFKVNVNSHINNAASNQEWPLKAVNGKFFLLGNDGLHYSNDGANWVTCFLLPSEEVGGPNYYVEDITFGNGVYAVVNCISYPTAKQSTSRYKSSNLVDWTIYNTHLPGHPVNGGSPQRIFFASSKFYIECFSALFESSDFISWTSIGGGVASGTSYIPLGDGFIAIQDNISAFPQLTWVPYSKGTLTELRTAIHYGLDGSLISYASNPDGVVLSSGYVYFNGNNSVKSFKYNTAWDDNDGVPPTPAVFSVADDTATTSYNTASVIDVLANDDGETLSIIGVTQPANGTAVVANGKITYTPRSTFYGTDTFTYTATNGTDTATGTITVTVSAPGITAPPVITNAPSDEIEVQQGDSYSLTLTATGGVLPYIWSIQGQSASANWLTINSSTGALSGTFNNPLASPGHIDGFQITVTDSAVTPKSGKATILFVLGESPYTATIQGTLRLDTSDGVFAARKVYLYDYTTGNKVAETTSDGTTGAWSFTQVAPGDYFVVGAAQGDDLNVPRDFDAMGVITVT